jgi:Rrf2 family protein
LLQISRRVEYALRAALHLAAQEPGVSLSFREIGEQQGIPKDFLAKILRTLVDAGIIESSRGSSGGFWLAREPGSVTFLEVIEAVEGRVALNQCSEHGEGCAKSPACEMRDVWQSAERAMLEVFRDHTLASGRSRVDLFALAARPRRADGGADAGTQ